MITLPLLAMILFFANPFAPKLIPVADGMGLNPMLRDWAMIIHPPILFAGYACLAVAFILATSRFDDSVGAQLLARWARLACGTLTAGIVTGALWAYDELGWGGYWGWDPVENASLIPWLISFALLHFSSRQATIVTRSAVMLSGLAFAGTIVATYLTRSGVVFSLHAFADNSSANVFLLALGIVILFTVIRALRTPRSINPLPGTMTLTMWWLIMMTLAVLIGTLWPVWAKMMIDNPQPLPASFYNTTVGLMGLGLMITLGVCSSRSIRRPRRIEVLLIAAALASVTCFTLWFFLGRFELLKLIGLFVLVADAVIIVFDMAGRRRQFLHRLPMTIAHLGLIVLSFGLLASLAQPTVKSLVLEKQQADKTGGLQVRLDNLRADERKDGTINVQADLEVSMPYRQETLHPSQTLLSDGRHRIEPDFRAGLFSDIYAVLEGFSGTQALVSVRRNWLVGWVWGGSGLILIGCLLATANRRRAN
jgi:cytochrome c-type biogenesis protein CcmF